MLYQDVQQNSEELYEQLTMFQFIFMAIMDLVPEEARKTYSDMQLWCATSRELLEGIIQESGATPNADDDAFDEVLGTLAQQVRDTRTDLVRQLQEAMNV